MPVDKHKHKHKYTNTNTDTWRREVARMPMANPITGLVILAEASSSPWSRWEERRRNDLENEPKLQNDMNPKENYIFANVSG